MAGDEGTSTGGVAVQVALLGAVSVRRGEGLEPVPGPRSRTLLAALAMEPGRYRSSASLIDAVWQDTPPRSPANALHTQLSRLRTVLGADVLQPGPAGYRLALPRAAVDLTRAQDLLALARTAAPAEALELVAAATAMWRGEPGADLGPDEVGQQLRATAEHLWTELEQVQVGAWLALGRFADALAPAEQRCARAPLDEVAHEQLMRCLAGTGRTNEALQVYAELRSRLAEQLGTDPAPTVTELHTALLRGQHPAATPASMPDAVGLRASATPLLGREHDLAALRNLLQSSRVVTVLGPGGTGKTRVAQALGASADLPVAVVELAGVRSPDDVLGAVCTSLNISEAEVGPEGLLRARPRTARERLRAVLSARPSMLVLDNCEHVVAACAELVQDLVSTSPVLTVLTTSRTPLMVAAEAVYPLPPLEVDEQGSPATDLFCARARAVRPSVRLDPAAVARLCRTLDGLPLAIELAAARVRTLSVEEISTRLADRFALLRGSDRTAPERHRTMHAVIEWSWNLLDDDQRAALRRLCRFPAGFTRDAATAVAGGPGCADVDAALEGLVNQSLLAVTEHPGTVGLRFHMLETVREFGEEQLAAGSGEAAAVARRQQEWARATATGLVALFAAGEQVAAVELMEAEHENLVAALRQGIAEADAATVLTLFPVLGLFWAMRGAHSEVVSWAPRVLDLQRASGRDGARSLGVDPGLVAASLVMVTLHLMAFGELRLAAWAKTRLRGVLASDAAGLDETVRLVVEVVLTGTSGPRIGRLLAHGVHSARADTRCLAHGMRAHLHENAGRRVAATRDALRVLELARGRGDLWVQGMAAQLLGGLHSQAARYAEAVGYYRVAAEVLAQLHAYEESAQVRGFMGAALVGAGQVMQGRAEAAAALHPQPVLTVGGQPQAGSGAVFHQSSVTATLAEADLADGAVTAGLQRYRSAVALSQGPEAELADGPVTALVASAAVCAHAAAGEQAAARELLTVALTGSQRLHARSGDRPVVAAVAVAASSVALGEPGQGPRAARLLALGARIGARQDYPALRLDRQLARARAALGAAAVDGELAATARLTSNALLTELLALLRQQAQALRM